MTPNPLLAKLAGFANLEVDAGLLLEAVSRYTQTVEARRPIVREGEAAAHAYLVLDGWAGSYKAIANGSRQFCALLLPGDFCNLHGELLGKMDHTIVALSDCSIAAIPVAEIETLTSNRSLKKAIWRAKLIEEAILRTWLVNNGRHDAHQRIAHLICELHARLDSLGLVSDGSFAMPMTQEDIADVSAVSVVHANRVLQRLRREKLIDFRGRVLAVLDLCGLRKLAEFDPSYLHLG